MTEQALAARRAYKRKWAADNPDKVKASQERYWERVARQAEQEQKQAADPPQRVEVAKA